MSEVGGVFSLYRLPLGLCSWIVTHCYLLRVVVVRSPYMSRNVVVVTDHSMVCFCLMPCNVVYESYDGALPSAALLYCFFGEPVDKCSGSSAPRSPTTLKVQDVGSSLTACRAMLFMPGMREGGGYVLQIWHEFLSSPYCSPHSPLGSLLPDFRGFILWVLIPYTSALGTLWPLPSLTAPIA